MLVSERPAEEHKVRPEIEQLGRVDRGYVIRLITEDDAAVYQNKCSESGEQGEERSQDFNDVVHPLRLSG